MTKSTAKNHLTRKNTAHNSSKMKHPPTSPDDLPGGVFEAPPVFSLAYFPGTEHIGSANAEREWLGYDQTRVPYPHQPYRGVLARLLLEPDPDIQIGNRSLTYLRLPENYVSMSQALNDAIGSRPHEHALDIARTLFDQLGDSLVELKTESQVIPESLHYKQVIFLRNGGGVNILPPLELVPDTRSAMLKMAKSFTSSTVEASATPVQVDSLFRAIQGFLIKLGVAEASYGS